MYLRWPLDSPYTYIYFVRCDSFRSHRRDPTLFGALRNISQRSAATNSQRRLQFGVESDDSTTSSSRIRFLRGAPILPTATNPSATGKPFQWVQSTSTRDSRGSWSPGLRGCVRRYYEAGETDASRVARVNSSDEGSRGAIRNYVPNVPSGPGNRQLGNLEAVEISAVASIGAGKLGTT